MSRGRVYIVGAGPGDPALLTVKALDLLGRADVVIYDRLVNPEILDLAKRSARRVYAGKRVGERGVQDRINAEMVSETEKGRIVVRLKGGDPLIFGRGGEEAEFLTRNKIEYEIVPGVSSVTAGPAYAGIPLTHRVHSSSVMIITGQSSRSGSRKATDWKSIVGAADTVVIMMGAAASSKIGQELIKAGLSADTSVAAIEWATTKRQRTRLFRLGVMAEGKVLVRPPSVIVVGSVASLAERLDWFRIKGKSTLKILSPARGLDGQ